MTEEYESYLSLTQSTQSELLETIDELKTFEEWDADTVVGLRRWAADQSMVFRALKRYRFDAEKTARQLLQTVSQRVDLSLHLPIAATPPYATSSLFYFLPLPSHTDVDHRPIAVLNISQVMRDQAGTLDGLKEWAWWMAEYSRRVICDWEDAEVELDEEGRIVNPWNGRIVHRKRENGGRKGSGYTLFVDATGAGYRNLELELVPLLLNIGHAHFPGLISKVVVVNLTWTQKYLWTVVQRVLPRYALEKISFASSKDDVAKYVNLEVLPRALGGNHSFIYDALNDHMRARHSRSLTRARSSASIAQSKTASRSRPPTRNSSHTSIAGVFTTPSSSPQNSTLDLPKARNRSRRRNGLQMTKTAAAASLSTASPRPEQQEAVDFESPVQRIKSLSDFHLYLSPSRLANIDLLADSDDDAGTSKPSKDDDLTIRGRRRRPALRCVTQPSTGPLHNLKSGDTTAQEHARSYSASLQRHHARGVETYAGTPPLPAATSAPDDASDVDNELAIDEVETIRAQPIEPFASNQNPWFGYPAMRVLDPTSDGSILRPRYQRNRKRDLVKTLLFLFVMRMQSFRVWLEKVLGLRALLGLALGKSYQQPLKASGPVEGFQRQTRESSQAVANANPEKDWLWMAVGFLLLRGDWARTLLLAPLELLLRLRSIAGHN